MRWDEGVRMSLQEDGMVGVYCVLCVVCCVLVCVSSKGFVWLDKMRFEGGKLSLGFVKSFAM